MLPTHGLKKLVYFTWIIFSIVYFMKNILQIIIDFDLHYFQYHQKKHFEKSNRIENVQSQLYSSTGASSKSNVVK